MIKVFKRDVFKYHHLRITHLLVARLIAPTIDTMNYFQDPLCTAKIGHHVMSQLFLPTSQTSGIKEPRSQAGHKSQTAFQFLEFFCRSFFLSVSWVSEALVIQYRFTALYRGYLKPQATWVAFPNPAQNRVVCVEIKHLVALSSFGELVH